MDNNITKERMNELIKIIEEANYNYHVLDNPTITDQEYDAYYRELEIIENLHCRKTGKALLTVMPKCKIAGNLYCRKTGGGDRAGCGG